MSLFSWLLPKSNTHSQDSDPESSGLSRIESTRPVHQRRSGERDELSGNGRPANRKGERMVRRELLYTVVRDCMTRAGVLSSSYKFKVLSLDGRGRQFLVMVDLAREAAGETIQLAEIEALVAQSAKSRYDIVVTSVYWRLNEHVAVGAPARGTASRPAPLEHSPVAAVPEEAPARKPPQLADRPREVPEFEATMPLRTPSPPLARGSSRYEPIADDEVTAFKAALAAGVKRPKAAPKEEPATQGLLLTGFEDTQLHEPGSPVLSGTQYGELR